jgi:hypothetical protein
MCAFPGLQAGLGVDVRQDRSTPEAQPGYPLPSELLKIFHLENHAVHAPTGQLWYVLCGCLALG